MDRALPVLVAQLADRGALNRLLRAALRHETVRLALRERPQHAAPHALDVRLHDHVMSLLAEPVGEGDAVGFPLRVKPLHRAQAAEIYALLEQDLTLADAGPEGGVTIPPPPAPDSDDAAETLPNDDRLDSALTPPPLRSDAPPSRAPDPPPLPQPPDLPEFTGFANLPAPSEFADLDLPPATERSVPRLRVVEEVVAPKASAVAFSDFPELPRAPEAPAPAPKARSRIPTSYGFVKDGDAWTAPKRPAKGTTKRPPPRAPESADAPAAPKKKKKTTTKSPRSSQRSRPYIPSSTPPADLIGRQIAQGKYTIESLIGSGAAGAVYQASHRDLRRTVAIKVLHPHYQKDAGFMKRFHGEALAASQLDHLNIMRVIDFGQDPTDGLVYIVMEYLPGGTLQSVLDKEQRLPAARAIDIMVQVCAALSVAHDKGIVHRDVKPDNIILVASRDDEGKPLELVKVCDFGIASLENPIDEGMQLAAGVVCGTPEYMSPEQGRGGKLDARSDVYACGITLYELLTGQPPFLSDNPIETLQRHAHEAPIPPSKLVKGIDPLVEEVILKAIEKDPSLRQQSARAMRLELKELLEADGTTPDPGVTRTPYEPVLPIEDASSDFPELFVALASAILEGGQFAKDHPDHAQAHRHVRRVMQPGLQGRGCMVFARRDTQRSVGFFVLAGHGEAVDLRRLLGPQIYATHGEPFVDALVKRGIVALTLREQVSHADLLGALQLLRLPHDAPGALAARFFEKNMRDVSVLFVSDVIGRDRKLSWKVGLAAALLVHDLVLLAHARHGSLRKAREQRLGLVREAIDMLPRPDELRQLLVNADLVNGHVGHTPGLTTFAIEELVSELAPAARLIELVQLVMVDHDTARKAGQDTTRAAALLRAMAPRLVRERSTAGDDVLRELHRRDVLADGDLPPDLSASVRRDLLADTLARDPLPSLRALDLVENPDDYAREAARLCEAMKTLARRGEAPALLAAITTLARHAQGKGGRPGPREEHALRAMRAVIEKEHLVPVAAALLADVPHVRDAAHSIIVFAGSPGALALLSAREHLHGAPNLAVFVATFKETGAAGWPLLLSALARLDPAREDLDANLAEDLLQCIPDRRDPPLVDHVAKFLSHPRLRRASLRAYAAVVGEPSRPRLLEALEHPDDGVRLVAISELHRVRAVDETVVAWIERLLAGRGGSDDLRAASALALGDATPPNRTRALAFLTRAIEGKRGLLATLRGDGGEESTEVLVTIARALLALDPREGVRIVRQKAIRADPQLRARLGALVIEKP